MPTAKLAALRLIVLVLVMGASAAGAETMDCAPITALPAVVTVQGVYCFTGNLAIDVTSGNAIEIQTNNVVLDLNGFKLGNLAAGPGGRGIFASDRQNITIKNGTIRGFGVGVLLLGFGSQRHIVEDIRVDQSTSTGIHVDGDSVIVRNNQVVGTRGVDLFGPDANGIGIFVSGTDPRVLNNDVINTGKQGAGVATGIYLSLVVGGLVINNRVTGADVGIRYDPFLSSTLGSGKYRDNLTFDVITPFLPGHAVDAGNNN